MVGLLAIEVMLFLSDHFRWLPFNEKKGYTVLAAVAAVGLALLAMLFAFIIALVFRWRFQFGLRSLLILVLATAVSCSWLAVEVERAERQRGALQALKKYPNIIRFDYESSPTQQGPPGPEVLRRFLGVEFFADVEFVCLGVDNDFTDAEIAHLEALPQLKTLNLPGAAITDTGVSRLATLRRLTWLDIGYAKISDAGLEHLAELSQLSELHINDTNVTDEGAQRLQHVLPTCKIVR